MDEAPEEWPESRSLLEATFEPWELDGGSKRDCAPHRAGLLILLSYFSIAATWLFVLLFPVWLAVPARLLDQKKTRRDPTRWACCLLCLFPALTAFGGSLGTRILAQRDLARMKAGDMDCRGYHETDKVWRTSRATLWLGVLGPLAWAILVALLFAPLLLAFRSGFGGGP